MLWLVQIHLYILANPSSAFSVNQYFPFRSLKMRNTAWATCSGNHFLDVKHPPPLSELKAYQSSKSAISNAHLPGLVANKLSLCTYYRVTLEN